MSDDFDVYGDSDPNNVPDGGTGQDTTAGDGLPGVAVHGYPGWRAGAFGSGRGLLGMTRVSDLVSRPGDGDRAMLQLGADEAPFQGGGDPRLILATNPKSSAPTVASNGHEAYPMPPAYIPDGHGGVQLRPDFAAAHPGAKDFGGMAREIDWAGVGRNLQDIANGVANAKIDDWIEDKLGIPWWTDLPKSAVEVWKAQDEANKDPGKPPRGADRVTNGLP